MGVSIFFTAAMIRAFRSARPRGLVCRRVLCVLCTKCTLHSYHRLNRVISQQTKRFLPGAAILSLHTLASPSGRNVHYEEKNLLEEKKKSCSSYLHMFRKYVSYGFPIINFCKTGVHYETPCIMSLMLFYIYMGPGLLHPQRASPNWCGNK